MKRVKKITFGLAVLGLLWIGTARLVETHDGAFTEEGLLETDASDLKDTIVTPHLQSAVAGEKNVLWCGSFQLAWNEACGLVGEALHFRENEPAMVGLLNTQSFTRQHIDEDSYKRRLTLHWRGRWP